MRPDLKDQKGNSAQTKSRRREPHVESKKYTTLWQPLTKFNERAKNAMTIESKQRIATLLTHDDSDTRRMAAEDLSETDNLATISALTAALQDDNKGVRDAASRSLVSIGGISVARGIAHYIAHEDIVTRNLA